MSRLDFPSLLNQRGLKTKEIVDAIQSIALAVRSGLTISQITARILAAPSRAYASYKTDSAVTLTATPAMVEFVVDDDIEGFSYSNGEISVSDGEGGEYEFTVERAYINYDQNPSDVVNVSIDVQAGGQSVFSRSLPINAAASPQEPAVLAFTSSFIHQLNDGEGITIYESAEDDGSDPSNAQLYGMRVVIKKIFSLD